MATSIRIYWKRLMWIVIILLAVLLFLSGGWQHKLF
jgi:hypothetical protein